MFTIIVIVTISVLFADYQSGIQESIENSKAKGYSKSEQQVAVAVYQYNEGYFEDALKSLCRADSLGIPEKLIPNYYLLYSGIYRELGNYKKALEYNEKILNHSSYDQGRSYYPMEIYNIYFKFKLGENIEDEKNNFLAKWKIKNEVHQYSLCDFLLKIEDYNSVLSAIKDYDKMLVDLGLSETNVQYILFVHAYYELGNYKKAKEYYNMALTIDTNDNTESYLHYWDSLINNKLGNITEAIISLKKGKDLGWDYHGRFILPQLWRFSEKNIEILEMIEKLETNGAIEKYVK